MDKATMPKLTRKAIKLKLESLIYKIDKTNIVADSIKDGFDNLGICITAVMHDLESTKRERDYQMKKLGK